MADSFHTKVVQVRAAPTFGIPDGICALAAVLPPGPKTAAMV